MNYLEYTTIEELRHQYLDALSTSEDHVLIEIIREASKMLNGAARQWFAPIIETRHFDVPPDGLLMFDRPLLALTTLTNGDATTISSSSYWLKPNDFYPKFGVQLRPSSGIAWLYDSNGDATQAISAAGVWGWHEDYTNAWQPLATSAGTAITLGAAITSTTSTAVTLSAGGAFAGQLLKIDSEYLYVLSASSTSATCQRGVNGSTAATHLNAASISVWTLDESVVGIVKRAAAALYKLRGNPVGETVTIDGQTYSTPKDVAAFIKNQVDLLGLQRRTG